MQILKIDFNQIKELPETFTNLESLTELYAMGNNFQKLPPNLENIKNLSTLDLDYNYLEDLPENVNVFLKRFQNAKI